MVLPAGIAPATVSFEASCADLLRYGSVSCDLKLIRPRATELLLTPSFCRRPAVDSGDGPASKLDVGSGRNWMPHLESHQDLRIQSPSCYDHACVLHDRAVLDMRVKWRGPTTRRQSDHDLLAMTYSDGISLGHGEAQSPRIISSAASE